MASNMGVMTWRFERHCLLHFLFLDVLMDKPYIQQSSNMERWPYNFPQDSAIDIQRENLNFLEEKGFFDLCEQAL